MKFACTVESELIEPCAMSLELPPRVRSGVFFVFLCLSEGLRSSFFAVFFTPIPEWGILDYIAQGLIIRDSTVGESRQARGNWGELVCARCDMI